MRHGFQLAAVTICQICSPKYQWRLTMFQRPVIAYLNNLNKGGQLIAGHQGWARTPRLVWLLRFVSWTHPGLILGLQWCLSLARCKPRISLVIHWPTWLGVIVNDKMAESLLMTISKCLLDWKYVKIYIPVPVKYLSCNPFVLILI